MYSNRKGVSSALVALALIVIIIAAGVYIYSQLKVTPPTPEEEFYGTAQIKTTCSNPFDQADISETSPTYKVYHTLGKELTEMVKADFAGGTTLTADTATDVDVSRDDEGYLAVWAYAGTAHFLDTSETQSANSRIKDVRTDLDVSGDGKRDTVFLLYLGDIAPPGISIKPVMELSLKALPDETADLTINNLSTQSMGTGSKTGSVEWTISAFEEKKAWTLARVYVVQNRTDEDKVKVTGISIGYGVGAFSGSDVTYETGAKRWSFNIGVENYREVQDGFLIKRPVAGTSYCSFTVSIETYFVGGDSGAEHTTLTIYIDEIAPTGTITTDSDAMILNDA